ncbi:hypothetical protein SISSUDRAFT_1068779 [Sistotremastrum suecicum HHB10207 ss-3]|uniref:Calcineurin-like phosphoesterase domain-containing protein n=1 Tax=Sistotremastrum suecicum HHB10207 ss-3 TaxID=1314776 RepID=A0A166I7P9_9AGAM|nr:hypothetical protein SISSUDRAFT_1068779 [Sistotremastrum suecicum HHB10207 ss-3]
MEFPKNLGGRRSSKELPRRPTLALLNLWRVILVLVVLWYELGSFSWAVAGCRWPDRELLSKRRSPPLGHTKEPIAHVLLVSDPQVPHKFSLRSRFPWMRFAARKSYEWSLRKSWRVAKGLRPDVVIFLGDMLNNGRLAMSDSEYTAYWRQFKSIFKISDHIPVHFLPGNRDVGLGGSKSFSPRARERFQKHFDSLNNVISIAGHTLLFLDAPDLVDEDYRRHAAGKTFEDWTGSPGGAIQFLQDFANVNHTEPVVVLTHIPLARPEGASCGPLRERGSIRRGVGIGYQNLLGKALSRFILQEIEPSVIFSGDDRDYCDFTHLVESKDGTVSLIREVTVKSFSVTPEIRRPGFQLLSLAPAPVQQPINADTPCNLPNQSGIFTYGYLPAIFICMLHVALLNYRRRPTALHLTRHKTNASEILPVWSAISDAGFDTFDDLPSRMDRPPMSGRSMLTASLFHPSRSGSLGSPWQSPSGPHSPSVMARQSRKVESGEPEEFDFPAAPSTPSIEAGTSLGAQWEGKARLTFGLDSLKAVLHQLLRAWLGPRRVIPRSRSWVQGFSKDVFLVAWPPMLMFLLIHILIL